MSPEPISRRRVITILAAATSGIFAGAPRPSRANAYIWNGFAMGTDAQIVFGGAAEAKARAAVEGVVAEIARLEGALSLFREDSEIRRLNRDGTLHSPTGDMRRALSAALDIAAATGGLYDPTVQVLWETYVDWFSAAPDAPPPPDSLLAEARRRVDWRTIALADDTVRLGPHQRITLNGLGQGYVTDRVADILRDNGFRHVLVDLGEQRALGPREDGLPWRVARSEGDSIALSCGALATSEGAGCVLGAGGEAHHLFDPRTGRSAPHWRRIIVHHASATVADALSTALYAARPDEIGSLIARLSGVTVWATDRHGTERRMVSPSQASVAFEPRRNRFA